MSLPVLIIVEIFLVLLGVGGYLFFTLFSLNKDLAQKKALIKYQLKDSRSRVKGLREKVQQQSHSITKLEKALSENIVLCEQHKAQIKQLEGQQQDEEQSLAELKVKNVQLKDQCQLSENKINDLTNQIDRRSEKKSQQLITETESNYKELYYDLKNSIAYSMSGGDQMLDTLADRLTANGNIAASKEIEELKQRYNSLGEMVGLVTDVELFDGDEKEIESERQNIEQTEKLITQVEQSLQRAKNISPIDSLIDLSKLEFTKDEMNQVKEKLDQLSSIKEQLTQELNKSNSQLRSFIAKAHLFQAQKEQICLHKRTEKQLHRNLSNMSNDYRQLTRRFKTLSTQNDILNTQLKNSTQDKELIERLNQLRGQLESKEEVMDRLILEKDMLEQQYLAMSEESNIELDSTQALKRLESEHQLLEQQFLELLNDFESTG